MKVAFYKKEKGTIVDYIIDMMSGFGGYSHCELIFDGNKEDYDYSKANCFGISGRDKGTRFLNINLKSGHWDIFEIIDESIDESVVFHNAHKYLNAKYDYFGIFFTCVLPNVWQAENKWWCSELGSMLLFGKDGCRISPNKFSKDIRLKKCENF
jgi:hypothetical protein